MNANPETGADYEMHEWAIRWPVLFGDFEQQTYAAEGEARRDLHLYGPTAWLQKIDPVRVEL